MQMQQTIILTQLRNEGEIWKIAMILIFSYDSPYYANLIQFIQIDLNRFKLKDIFFCNGFFRIHVSISIKKTKK